MSFFSWFKSKSPSHRGHEASTRTAPLAAVPRNAKATGADSNGADSETDTAARRKNERARLRDMLYNVVRESMVRVGVLSSSFKFKVLATDPRGRKFIVMMDLSRDFGSEISQLAEIEALICQAAKARHNIVVSSVYWRAEDQVAPEKAGNTPSEAQYRATVPHATPAAAQDHGVQSAPLQKSGGSAAEAPKPHFDPVLAGEVMALKQALSAGSARQPALSAATPEPSKGTGQLTGYEKTEFLESETPEEGAETEVADTEILDDEARYPALSATQYGDLR